MRAAIERLRDRLDEAPSGGVDTALFLVLLVLAAGLLVAAARTDVIMTKGVDIGFLLGMRVLNVLLFAGVVGLTYALGRRLFDARVALFAAALVVPTQLANHAIIAWTHVPTTFFILLAYYAYDRFLEAGTPRWLYLLAVAGGMTFTIKYPDAVMLLPLLLHGGYTLVRRDGWDVPRRLAGPVLVLLVVLAPTLAFHQLSFGGITTTPYHERPNALPPNDKENIATTFDPGRLLHTIPAMLIRFDPEMPLLLTGAQDFEFREYKSALFQTSPFLALGLMGMLLARGRRRTADLALAGSAALLLTYGSWAFFSGGWTTNMRYLTPIVPFLALFTAVLVDEVVGITGDLYRYGGGAAAILFVAGIVLFHGRPPIAVKATMNLITVVVATTAVLAFALAYRQPSPLRRVLAGATLAAAVAAGGVMVFVLDNWMLFYGAKSSIVLWNATVNAVPLLVLAAAGAGATVIGGRELFERVT